ncbi:hypothetical protein ACIBSV_10995 [Embleya sp. NPDC050154]|uniref:hypothetical protein n=1 Tax=Embleya sp. NPDC050154 TaxID=3363988 RepID=UPI0037B12CCF
MSTHPAIADHGTVGDLLTAAPLYSGKTIDRWRTPRLEGPGVSASLLDGERGATAGRPLISRADPPVAAAIAREGHLDKAERGGAGE